MKNLEWPDDAISHWKEVASDCEWSVFVKQLEDYIMRLKPKSPEIAEELFRDLYKIVTGKSWKKGK